jgi:hypothetical protein
MMPIKRVAAAAGLKRSAAAKSGSGSSPNTKIEERQLPSGKCKTRPRGRVFSGLGNWFQKCLRAYACSLDSGRRAGGIRSLYLTASDRESFGTVAVGPSPSFGNIQAANNYP